MWNIIHSETTDKSLMSEKLYNDFNSFKKRLINVCKYNQIPYVEKDHSYRYYTFGGYLINKAIALITNQFDFTIDDISLRCSIAIDWNLIPVEPKNFEPVFHSLFEMTSNQSLYQTLLPENYQLQEYLQDWLKDRTIVTVLNRLKKSTAVKVDPDIFNAIIVSE